MAITKGITAFYPSYVNGISGFEVTFPPAWSTAGKAVLSVNQANQTPLGLGSLNIHVWSGGSYTNQAPDSGTSNQFTVNKTTAAGTACVLGIQVVQNLETDTPAGTMAATYANGSIAENPPGTGQSISLGITNFQISPNSSGISVSVVLSGGGGM